MSRTSLAPFHRLDVPGEGDEVAPVAFFREHADGGVDVARGQRGLELAEKGLNAGIGRRVEHRFLPIIFIRRPPDGLTGKMRAFSPACKPKAVGFRRRGFGHGPSWSSPKWAEPLCLIDQRLDPCADGNGHIAICLIWLPI